MNKLHATVQRYLCQFLHLKERAMLNRVNWSWNLVARSASSWSDTVTCTSKDEMWWAFAHGLVKPRNLQLTWKGDNGVTCPLPMHWLCQLEVFSWTAEVKDPDKDPINLITWLQNCTQLQRLHLHSTPKSPHWVAGVLPPLLKILTGNAQVASTSLENLTQLEVSHGGHRAQQLIAIMSASKLQHLTIRDMKMNNISISLAQPWLQQGLRVLRLPYGRIGLPGEYSWLATALDRARFTLQEVQLPNLGVPLSAPFVS
jgi:hypothetical protein